MDTAMVTAVTANAAETMVFVLIFLKREYDCDIELGTQMTGEGTRCEVQVTKILVKYH